MIGHVTPTRDADRRRPLGDRPEHGPHERRVALLVDPRVEVVGDRDEVEAVLLGQPGDLDQPLAAGALRSTGSIRRTSSAAGTRPGVSSVLAGRSAAHRRVGVRCRGRCRCRCRGGPGWPCPVVPSGTSAASASSCVENHCTSSIVPHSPLVVRTSWALPSRRTIQSGSVTSRTLVLRRSPARRPPPPMSDERSPGARRPTSVSRATAAGARRPSGRRRRRGCAGAARRCDRSRTPRPTWRRRRRANRAPR